MDDAVAVRRAASDAVGMVEPEPLQATLQSELEACSRAPGALVVASARAIDGGVEIDRLADRAAGVQLIYTGLRLTRRLAAETPWTTGDPDGGNLGVLAAEILVARGAYLLAGTEASGAAVEVIRAFGRDQVERETEPGAEHALETDVFELAAFAGGTAVGPSTPPQLLEWSRRLAAEVDGEGLPDAVTVLTAEAPTGPLPVAEDGGVTDEGRVTSSGDR